MSAARNGRLAKSALWLAVQDGYTLFVMFLIGIFCARYLGPDGYGLLNYAMSFVSVFAAICQLGLDASVMNALVENPLNAGCVVGSALALRSIAAAFSQIGLLAAVSVVRGGDQLLLALTLIQGVSLLFDARLVFNSYFEYRLETRRSAIAQIAGITALCVMRAVLILIRADLIWFALSISVQSFVSFCVSASLFRRSARVRLSFSLAQAGRLLSSGAFFMLAGVAATLYLQIDRLMIGAMLSDADVGWYSVAIFVALVGRFVPDAFIVSARPLLLKLKREDDSAFAANFQALAFGAILLSAVLGVGLLVLGPSAISLVYGEAYAPAGQILRVLCFTAVFATMNRMRDLYFLACGLNHYSLTFALLGAVVNILLNLIVIPRWGLIGAAAATFCAYITTALLAPLAFPKTRPFARLVILSPTRAREAFTLLRELGKEENA